MSSNVRGKAIALAIANSSASHAKQPGIPSKARSGMAGGGAPAQTERPTPSCTLLRRPPLD